MVAKYDTQSPQYPAVEFLAKELHMPVDDVASLYGKELAKLTIGARVTAFLSIFAIRNVRRGLHARKTGTLAVVLGVP